MLVTAETVAGETVLPARIVGAGTVVVLATTVAKIVEPVESVGAGIVVTPGTTLGVAVADPPAVTDGDGIDVVAPTAGGVTTDPA